MIAFICHPYHRGGVTRWMVDFAFQCAVNNQKVIFITLCPRTTFLSAGNSETIISLLRARQHPNIQIVYKSVGWEFEFGNFLYKTNVYADLLRENVPDNTVVIMSDDRAAWNVSKYICDTYSFLGVLHSDDELYYNLASEYYRHIKALICVSDTIKKKLYKKFPYLDLQVETITCGIILPEYPEYKDNEKNTLKLIYVGRIEDPQKRPLDLVPIVESLSKQGVSFSLKIIGEGPEKPLLEERMQIAALSDHVHFLGWQSQETIYKELSGANILLLTSAYEGMPIVVMEALACGCSIVSTKVSGVEDYGESELSKGIIWLNEVGDTQQAVTNILLAREKEFNRIKARNLAEQEFSMALCYKRYMKLISELGDEKLLAEPFPWVSLTSSYLRALSRYIRLRFMA